MHSPSIAYKCDFCTFLEDITCKNVEVYNTHKCVVFSSWNFAECNEWNLTAPLCYVRTLWFYPNKLMMMMMMMMTLWRTRWKLVWRTHFAGCSKLLQCSSRRRLTVRPSNCSMWLAPGRRSSSCGGDTTSGSAGLCLAFLSLWTRR